MWDAKASMPPLKSGYSRGSLTEGEGSLRLTSLYKLVWIGSFLHWKYYLPFLQKQAVLMRRSTVLSLPLQIVFPGHSHRQETHYLARILHSLCLCLSRRHTHTHFKTHKALYRRRKWEWYGHGKGGERGKGTSKNVWALLWCKAIWSTCIWTRN